MSRGRGLRTSTAVERSGVVMPPTASDPAEGAMKLSTELGKGAACIRTLLAELQNDDNSTLWWLWRIAMLQPQAPQQQARQQQAPQQQARQQQARQRQARQRACP